MFFQNNKEENELPFSPFKAIVGPRPIGWISSISSNGIPNLAPYSFFNAIASRPDILMFSSQGWKDSVTNIDANGEFVCNYLSHSMLDAMNVTTAHVAPHVNEFELADLQMEQSKMVRPPRVRGVAAALECKAISITELTDIEGQKTNHFMVIGQVVGTYIDDEFIKDGRFDVRKASTVTRMGYLDYSTLGDLFELNRPD